MKKYFLVAMLGFMVGCSGNDPFLNVVLGDNNEEETTTNETNTDSKNDNSQSGGEGK